jgi:3-methylcrotonyl-CoA carboxylase alpha subunit
VVNSTGQPLEVTVDVGADGSLCVRAGEAEHTLSVGAGHAGLVPLSLDGRRLMVGFARLPDGRYQVVVDGISRVLQITDPVASSTDATGAGSDGGAVRAPIPGLVVTVHVTEGDTVERGAPLVTLYAMKLENEIRAPLGGVVAEIGASTGRAVEKGELLVRLDKA